MQSAESPINSLPLFDKIAWLKGNKLLLVDSEAGIAALKKKTASLDTKLLPQVVLAKTMLGEIAALEDAIEAKKRLHALETAHPKWKPILDIFLEPPAEVKEQLDQFTSARKSTEQLISHLDQSLLYKGLFAAEQIVRSTNSDVPNSYAVDRPNLLKVLEAAATNQAEYLEQPYTKTLIENLSTLSGQDSRFPHLVVQHLVHENFALIGNQIAQYPERVEEILGAAASFNRSLFNVQNNLAPSGPNTINTFWERILNSTTKNITQQIGPLEPPVPVAPSV